MSADVQIGLDIHRVWYISLHRGDMGVASWFSPLRNCLFKDEKQESRDGEDCGVDIWLIVTYCEISPVFAWIFWLSFPVWSVTLMLAERLGSPIISIFLVGVLSVLSYQ